MFAFGEKHPILFEIILFVVSFIAAALFTVVGSVFYLPSEISSSIGRIIVGLLLILFYMRAFKGNSFTKGFVSVLPALLFVVWNFYYNLSAGKQFGDIPATVITALAPAIYEEVVFRGIFLYNLKKHGYSDMSALLVSAAFFAAVHLTNIAGMAPALVALQVGYSFVIGMVFAAIYLKNRSLLQIILVHFLIDFSTQVFAAGSDSASSVQIILFAVLLALEAIYALFLVKKAQED